MLDMKFNVQNSKFDAINDRFDKKFDKLSSEIHEQKIKCESNFSELKNLINETKKHVESTHEIFKNNLNKLDQNIERMGVDVINTDKSKTSENYNETYKNVVLENKVTNDKNNDNDIENGNVIQILM